jgi:beta-lactamase superfamily II metal-dependent hydrolase
MAWNLEIHTIDVAQGESSLIVAYTDDGLQFKSMLVDGGLAKYGRLVNDYVSQRLGVRPLDVMVTSHYDTDHSGGQISLFQADNLTAISNLIGNAVGTAMSAQQALGGNQMQNAVAAFAAFVATVAGAYVNGRSDTTGAVQPAITASLNLLAVANPVPATNDDAMNLVFDTALNAAQFTNGRKRRILDKELMKIYNSGLSKAVGKVVVNAALPAVGAAAQSQAASIAFFNRIAPPPTQAGLVQRSGRNYNFRTNERYRQTRIFNPGNVGAVGSGISSKDLASYFNSLDGRVVIASHTAEVPLLPPVNQVDQEGRVDRVPNLGDELWGINDPAGPRVYCVAILQHVLNSMDLVPADNGNGISIGLAIVFNNFVFYTGGDLPADGLDLIPDAVINNPLMGNPAAIPAYKAGHHGSDNSNSAQYLTDSGTRSAVISSGSRVFNGAVLPRQVVINWLDAAPLVTYYYLTNAKAPLVGVPATNAMSQLVIGNKSRVAGDNKFDPGETPAPGTPFEPKQSRGNIVLRINEAQSRSAVVFPTPLLLGQAYRQFTVDYFEEEDNPLGPVDTPIGQRNETIYY